MYRSCGVQLARRGSPASNREEQIMSTNRVRSIAVTLALVLGAGVGAAGIAAAASNGTDGSGNSPPAAGNPAALKHGPGEQLLTGSTAARVRAAALAAVPGATVIRVETDSAGAAYEAHLSKADGTEVTVKVDSAFKVTATQQGFGAPSSGQGF
jgi:hypothetical protein